MRAFRVFKAWLTFWVAGALILLAACMVALRLPQRPTQHVAALAGRLTLSATNQARAVYGYGRLM